MGKTTVPYSFDIFEEGIAALCMEFADELGVTVETHQNCIETISVQALPIARNPAPVHPDDIAAVEAYTTRAEFFDVPIHFENLDASTIRVQVNKGIMAVINAAERFVQQ